MHVISRKRLNEFVEHHSDAKSSLAHWYSAMKGSDFSNFVELRAIFPSADQVGKLTVFNIGGIEFVSSRRSTIIDARFTCARC